MKKILVSLGLCCTMLFSSVPVFANSVDINALEFDKDGVAVVESYTVHTTKAHGSSDDYSKGIQPMSVEVGGGTWDYGVKMNALMYVWQFSDYNHPTKTHYATAMMNDEYSEKVKALKGIAAKAASPKFSYLTTGYTTNRSWYDVD